MNENTNNENLDVVELEQRLEFTEWVVTTDDGRGNTTTTTADWP